MTDSVRNVGVLDKSVAIVDALVDGPASLADLVDRTGLARPTVHRLAVALEAHDVLRRDVSRQPDQSEYRTTATQCREGKARAKGREGRGRYHIESRDASLLP